MADQITDERLLEQAAGGDGTAFQILYERYRDPIFRFAYRLLGSAEAAEDVAHDCFLSLIKEPGRFNAARASLRTYLFAAARNLAVKRYHSFGRETALDEVVDEIAAVVGADSNTVKQRLFRAREKLRARLDRYFRIGRETASAQR